MDARNTIGLASKQFHAVANWVWEVDPDRSQLLQAERRISKTATLSGGVYISDFGYTDGDRRIAFVPKGATGSDEDYLMQLMRGSGDVTLSMWDGVYLGKLRNVTRYSYGLKIEVELQELISG